MSRKILFSICLFLFSVLWLCAFSGCKKPLEELAPPDNVKVEKRIVTWDAVDNATGYTISIGENEFLVSECQFSIHSLTVDGGNYSIDVMAMGDGKKYDDSSWARIDVSLEPPIQEGYDESKLYFTLLEDKSGYSVTRGQVDINGVITIPEYFGDYPVKEIEDYAFSEPNHPFEEALIDKAVNKTITGMLLPDTLESIGTAAFALLARLEEIVIPDSVTSIGRDVFRGCNHLKKVSLPKGLKSIPPNCFRNTALTEITLPESLERIGAGAFMCEYDTTYISGQTLHLNSELSCIVIPASVKEIGNSAFYGRENLSTITLPDTLETFGSTVFHETAWYHSQPDGYALLGNCLYEYKGELPENSEITIPENLKVVSYAFARKANLIKVVIPPGIELIGTNIFANCPNLKEVILSEELEELPNMIFYEATSLKSITIPDTVSIIGSGAFKHSGLESIYIPGSVKTIGQNAFARCENLHTVYMEDGVEELGSGAFSNCPNLVNIRLPNTLQQSNGTGGNWFFKCGAEMMVVPAALEEIYFFGKCENLKSIYYEGTVDLWNKYTEDTGKTLDSYFPNAVFYLYSEEKPETEGNFWRYVDGVPTIW